MSPRPGGPRGANLAALIFGATLLFSTAAPSGTQAQFGPPPPPKPPRAAAPIDLTGYWVSVVTEDWRFRMIVPDRGDFASVPLSLEGRKVANDWDPRKDQASGNQCRSYGAAAIMRVPGRLHITWQNDNTLRIDADSGTQTRLLHFGLAPQPDAVPSWQGFSAAEWQGARGMFNPYMGTRGNRLRRVTFTSSPRACCPATCARTEFRTAPTPSSRSISIRSPN
jgi:hypothetical protein